MVILKILILLVQEHSIFIHLFVSSSVSFISVLHLMEYKSFASLGGFIPRCFILFDTMVNGIVSLISQSDISLLVYRNATDFCILILYPATLLNSLMSSSSFLVVSLGFSMYSRQFYLFPSNLDTFSSLIAVATTSKTVLNKFVRVGILVLLLILEEMLLAFHS